MQTRDIKLNLRPNIVCSVTNFTQTLNIFTSSRMVWMVTFSKSDAYPQNEDNLPFFWNPSLSSCCDLLHYVASTPNMEGLSKLARSWQHGATKCNQVQPSATKCNQVQASAMKCNKVQQSATKCNKVQQSATNYNQARTSLTHLNPSEHIWTHLNPS